MPQHWLRQGFAASNDKFAAAHRLTGPLNFTALEQSLNQLVQRQAVLRTVVRQAGVGVPMQQVLPSLQIELTLEDLSALAPSAREPALQLALQTRFAQSIDLQVAPLFKVGLYRLKPNEHVLYFAPHPLIWDGRSLALFHEEMAILYAAYSLGREPELVVPSPSYIDFAQWQDQWLHSAAAKHQLAYWKTELCKPPDPLDLPVDRPRPMHMSGRARTQPLAVSAVQADALRRFGESLDATLFETLLAAYAAFLTRVCGQTEVVIGTEVCRRSTVDADKLMGRFSNPIPLRLRAAPELAFAELVRHAREVVRGVMPYQDVPFEHLVRELNIAREASRPTLYQAVFNFQEASRSAQAWGEICVEPVEIDRTGATHDLELWFREEAQGLRGGLSCNADVCTEPTSTRLGERFELLLAAAVASPQTPVGRLPLTSNEERATLSRWNATTAEFAADTVSTVIGRQTSLTPDAAALRIAGTSLSYAQLDARVNRLARALRDKGIGRGKLVGLHLERSADMLAAQLAVLKAGSAYVPLDPAYPPERLAYMAQDAQLAAVVTVATLGRSLQLPGDLFLFLDSDAETISRQPDTPLAPDSTLDARPEDPAYVIYTSGSTGKPKGVVVQHRAVVNFLASMSRVPGLRAADRVLAVTTLSFDIAVLELLLPLSVGAEVVLALRETAVDGKALRALLESSGATLMQATPATWRLLIDAGWRGGPDFKALVGGEALSQDLAQQLLARSGELWNMYGPTETTVWSTCWQVRQPDNGISIGRPIANTQVHVLDEQLQVCPIGVPGEIYIGGEGVTLGYLNRPELTAERFIADPFGGTGRLYRTGDRGRWHHDGLIEHLGRLDFQVKVRGFRIELGEIESNLGKHEQVSHCVVIAREDQPGDVRLAAYFVAKNGAPSAAALREHLRLNMPEYMVPQHFIMLAAIPTLPNGKIDRKALPAPTEAETIRDSGFVAPRSQAEAAIAEIWQRLLNVERVSAADNFFDLGGHSLLAMRAVNQMEERLGTRIPVRSLVHETVAAIAAAAEAGSHQAAAAPAKSGGWFARVVSLFRR
ncbi:MAG: amino acid adenylation domain-containing protein [Burkholderiaceae bacterium]